MSCLRSEAPRFNNDELFDQIRAPRRFILRELSEGAAAMLLGLSWIIETAFAEERAEELWHAGGQALAQAEASWLRVARARWQRLATRHRRWTATRRLADLSGHAFHAALPGQTVQEVLDQLCQLLGCCAEEMARCRAALDLWVQIRRQVELLVECVFHRHNLPHRQAWHAWLVARRGHRHLYRQLLWRLLLPPDQLAAPDPLTVDRLDRLEAALFQAGQPSCAELLTELLCHTARAQETGGYLYALPLLQLCGVWARLSPAGAGTRQTTVAWLQAWSQQLERLRVEAPWPLPVRFACGPSTLRLLTGKQRATATEQLIWLTGRAGLVLGDAAGPGGRARTRLACSAEPPSSVRVLAALAFIASDKAENHARWRMPSVQLWQPFERCLSAWEGPQLLACRTPAGGWRLYRSLRRDDAWSTQTLFRAWLALLLNGRPEDLRRLPLWPDPRAEQELARLPPEELCRWLAALDLRQAASWLLPGRGATGEWSPDPAALQLRLAHHGLTLLDLLWGGSLRAALATLWAAQSQPFLERIRAREAHLHRFDPLHD